jgi:hypothetical protein
MIDLTTCRKERRKPKMLIKKPSDIKSAEITDQKLYLDRRKFMIGGSAVAAGMAIELSLPGVSSRSESHALFLRRNTGRPR